MLDKFRVVVVEDEPRILQSISNKIHFLDPRFEVVGMARNGEVAFSMVEQLKPHVVFSDVQMPVLDGLELLKRLKTTKPDIRSVIISGYRNFDYVRDAFRYEATDYLVKPIIDEELSNILSRLATDLKLARKQVESHD